MPSHRFTVALTGVLLIAFALHANADTLSFQEGDGGAYSSTASTTINRETGLNHGTSIVLTVVTADIQALIRFPDIIGSNPGQIPPGSTITSASLGLTMYAVYNIATTNFIHEVFVAWDENTVTGFGFYALPGTLYGPASGSIPPNDPYGATSGDVTSIVQDWADGESNWGVMLRLETPPTPEEGFYITQYFSDDATDPSWRPKLTVQFTPPEVAVEATTWGRVKALYR